MIDPPLSFADTPVRIGAPSAGPDVLSEMLRGVRLTGSVFLSGRFSAPFGVLSPKRYDAAMPMAHLRHVSIFHLIASGGCNIETAKGERREIGAGDLLLLPFADQHRFWNGDAPETVLRRTSSSPARSKACGWSITAAAAPKPGWSAASSSPRSSCSRRCFAPCRSC
jgi:mannose-6-phosphate isomerase-like protein (cupin superfamily)